MQDPQTGDRNLENRKVSNYLVLKDSTSGKVDKVIKNYFSVKVKTPISSSKVTDEGDWEEVSEENIKVL